MKLLRSKGARAVVVVSPAVVLASLGARGRRRLVQPRVREGSCSQSPRANWCTFMLLIPICGGW